MYNFVQRGHGSDGSSGTFSNSNCRDVRGQFTHLQPDHSDLAYQSPYRLGGRAASRVPARVTLGPVRLRGQRNSISPGRHQPRERLGEM